MTTVYQVIQNRPSAINMTFYGEHKTILLWGALFHRKFLFKMAVPIYGAASEEFQPSTTSVYVLWVAILDFAPRHQMSFLPTRPAFYIIPVVPWLSNNYTDIRVNAHMSHMRNDPLFSTCSWKQLTSTGLIEQKFLSDHLMQYSRFRKLPFIFHVWKTLSEESGISMWDHGIKGEEVQRGRN